MRFRGKWNVPSPEADSMRHSWCAWCRLLARQHACCNFRMYLPEFENPYAAPTAEILIPDDFGKLRREGRFLVVPNKWRTPPICLFTGDTHDLTQLRRTQLTWINPWFSWLLLAGIAPYFIAGLFLQKHGTFYFCLSKRYAGKHLMRVVLNWLLFLLPLSQIVFVFENGLFPWAVGVWVLSAALATTWCRLIKVGEIDSHSIYLKGIPKDVQEKIIRMDAARRVSANQLPGFPASS